MNQEPRHYIYVHIRTDKNEPFYIGQGVYKRSCNPNIQTYYQRAYQTSGRSNLWQKITNKTSFEVKILAEGLTQAEAHTKERELVTFYGRLNIGTGILANLTEGGEKTTRGCKLSEGHKEALRKASSGRRHTEEAKKKISIANKQQVWTEERKEKMSTAKRKFLASEKGKQWREDKAQRMKNLYADGKPHPLSKQVVNTATGEVYQNSKQVAKLWKMEERKARGIIKGNWPRYYNNTTFIYLEDYLPYITNVQGNKTSNS